jgi:hypothetical protein
MTGSVDQEMESILSKIRDVDPQTMAGQFVSVQQFPDGAYQSVRFLSSKPWRLSYKVDGVEYFHEPFGQIP